MSKVRTPLSRVGLCLAVASSAAVLAVAAAYAASRTVITTGHVKRGIVLVNSRGFTLYAFTRDSRGKSRCYRRCATVWKPSLASGRVVAKKGAGIQQRLLRKIRRPNGSYQVSYNGHPLYLFARDKRPGQSFGEGKKQFGGRWYVAGKNGNLLKPRSVLVGGY